MSRNGRLQVRLSADTRSRVDSERALRLTEEYIAVVSHELRTPLSAIINWAQVLQSAPADRGVVSRAAKAIERNARLQAHLVNDLLDVSRMTVGKMKLVKTICNLDNVVQSSLMTLDHKASAKRITMGYVAADKISIYADERRLQQVVVNLLGNAIKFTPTEGAVSVEVSRDGGQAVISVGDTGCGFAPELLPHIFERFRQAQTVAGDRVGGLGLGLHIVKSIVDLHGGTAQAYSDGPGKGATFTIRLPCQMGQLQP